jgi:hypothetical protein
LKRGTRSLESRDVFLRRKPISARIVVQRTCAAALATALCFSVAYAEPADHQGGASMGASQAGAGNGPSAKTATPGGGAITGHGEGREAAISGGAGTDKTGDATGAKAPMKSSKERDKAANAKDGNANKAAEREKSGDYGEHDKNRREARDSDRMNDETSAERHDRNAESSRHDHNDKTAESKDRKDHKSGKRAEFNASDKQKVKQYFSEHKPRAKHIDRDRINVTIGVGIPGSIALYPLPAGIVVAAGGCPLQYFLWGDDLVVVDSCSREVVDIVPGIG